MHRAAPPPLDVSGGSLSADNASLTLQSPVFTTQVYAAFFSSHHFVSSLLCGKFQASSKMSGEWQHGLFGCFDNFGLCIISYFVPCYQFGKNAEAIGESCFTCGLAYICPIINIFAALKIRGKIREQKGIAGSTLNDLLMICFCTLCALVQEAQEVQGAPAEVSMARE